MNLDDIDTRDVVIACLGLALLLAVGWVYVETQNFVGLCELFCKRVNGTFQGADPTTCSCDIPVCQVFAYNITNPIVEWYDKDWANHSPR